MPTVLVTGTNRGIGLEFVRQYTGRGWSVVATCRHPESASALGEIARSCRGLRIETLDLTDADSIDALARRLAGLSLDVLIHNAAFLGPAGPQQLGQWEEDTFLDAMRANAVGPALLTQRLLPLVEAGTGKKIVFLGSAAGSIGSLREPATLYAYRASKAALHLVARNLSIELAPRGLTVALINPGLVDTRGLLDLAPDDPGPEDLRPVLQLVRAGVVPLIRPAESVDAMIRLIDAWPPGDSGRFLNCDGTPLPW